MLYPLTVDRCLLIAKKLMPLCHDMSVHLLIMSNMRHAWNMIYTRSMSCATQGDRLSYYSAKPVQLELSPSANLVWMIALASLTACLVLLFLPLPVALKALSVALIVALAVYYIRQHGTLTLTRSIVRLALNPESGLQVTERGGRSHQVTVLPNSFVAPYLTVLNLQATESKRYFSLLLLADNVDPEGFRQLRVWLRWGRERQEADNLS